MIKLSSSNVDETTRSGFESAWNRFQAFSPGDASQVRVFFAPGRVNLIGEHIDYNGGHVFPAALTLGTWVFARRREDRVLRFASTAFQNEVTCHLDTLKYDEADDYANYPKGVIWAMRGEGVDVSGMDLLYYGNLPNSAGLSSSASIQLATAQAFNSLFEAGFDSVKLALLSQLSENRFVGVNCGIMDQFSSAMGKESHAILLDCATLEYQHVPFEAPSYRLVIANTNRRRGLADSKYNERRSECEEAVHLLQDWKPIKYLAQVTPTEWTEAEDYLKDETVRKRARHVVTEEARVQAAAQALAEGDFVHFGKLLNESHISLRDDYEVTGAELDALAESAWKVGGCLGSRMTGAGFGGCTVSLVHTDHVDDFVAKVGEDYRDRTGITASFYVTEIGDGAREVTDEVMRLL